MSRTRFRKDATGRGTGGVEKLLFHDRRGPCGLVCVVLRDGPETGGVGRNSLVGGGKERVLQLYPQRFDGSVDPGEVGK